MLAIYVSNIMLIGLIIHAAPDMQQVFFLWQTFISHCFKVSSQNPNIDFETIIYAQLFVAPLQSALRSRYALML